MPLPRTVICPLRSFRRVMSSEVRAAIFPSSYLVVSESNLLRAITVFCSPGFGSRAWHILLIANPARLLFPAYE